MLTLDPKEVLHTYQHTGKAEFFYRYVHKEVAAAKERRASAGESLTVLDVGCGGGFHHRDDLQTALGAMSTHFIGVEPDTEAKLNPAFETVYATVLEKAPIASASVDVAYSVMVMEHVTEAQAFFDVLDRILKPGGVYLGYTVDARHWFSKLSTFMAATGIKDKYLDLIRGKRGEERYENFPTAYKCNTPKQLTQLCAQQFNFQMVSLHKIGQMDFYLPSVLHGVSHLVDRATLATGLPGSSLLFVAQKKPNSL